MRNFAPNPPKARAAWIAGLAVLFVGMCAPIAAGEATPEKPAKEEKPADDAEKRTVASALMVAYPESEQPIYELLMNAFKEAETSPVIGFLKGRKPVDFTARTAAFTALEKNLSIQLSAHDTEVRNQMLREARAVLLPVFDVGFSMKHSRTFRRKRTTFLEKRILDPVTNPSFTPFPPFPPPSKISEIVLLGFNKEIVPGKEFASKPSQKKPDNTQTFTLSISQQMPWGGAIKLTNTTVRRKRYQSRKYPKSFRLPWTTNFLGEYVFPLPYTKFFGPYSAVDANMKQARVSRDQAMWNFRTVINSTLLTVDLTYWELVNRALSLQSTRQNRIMVEELLKQNEKLMQNQRATVFDKTQLESELARVQNLETQAWNNFILVSDSLVDLLSLDSDFVLIPRGYATLLPQRMEYEQETAVALGLENRPELKVEELNEKFAWITHKNRVALNRPDLSVSGSINLKQDNSKVGFPKVDKALEHMFNEDQRIQKHSATYNRPLFKRAEGSLLRQAELDLEATKLQTRLTANQVEQEVNNALSDLQAAAVRLEEAKKAVDAAKKSFDAARKLREAGRLTEFEMISQTQSWLSSDLSHILAQIVYKQAETSLLAAQGLLPNLFPEKTAPNEFERFRLKLLESAQVRDFFGGAAEKKDVAEGDKKAEGKEESTK